MRKWRIVMVEYLEVITTCFKRRDMDRVHKAFITSSSSRDKQTWINFVLRERLGTRSFSLCDSVREATSLNSYNKNIPSHIRATSLSVVNWPCIQTIQHFNTIQSGCTTQEVTSEWSFFYHFLQK